MQEQYLRASTVKIKLKSSRLSVISLMHLAAAIFELNRMTFVLCKGVLRLCRRVILNYSWF